MTDIKQWHEEFFRGLDTLIEYGASNRATLPVRKLTRRILNTPSHIRKHTLLSWRLGREETSGGSDMLPTFIEWVHICKKSPTTLLRIEGLGIISMGRIIEAIDKMLAATEATDGLG